MNFRFLSHLHSLIRPWVIALCLTSLHVSSSYGAEACHALFTDNSYQILNQSAISRLKAKWATYRGQITSDVIRRRYEDSFLQIYSDIAPDFLKKAQFRFVKDIDGGLAETNVLNSEIRFLKKIKNHWLYPVLHAHELQHYFDLESGRVHVEVERTGFLSREIHVHPAEILRTEVRAHYRHWRALNILLTTAEVKHLLDIEKDPQIKKFIQEYVDYGGSSVNYIGMVLKTGYSVTLRNAFRASGQISELMYLTSVIESEIYNE